MSHTYASMSIARHAILPDVPGIHSIIQPYAEAGILLPRTPAELSENVRDFVVTEENGHVAACGALHLYGMHLAEIRSIAVAPEWKGRGYGRAIVSALLEESRRHEVSCVCLFTRSPDFFAHLGFAIARRQELPDKITRIAFCARSSPAAMKSRWSLDQFPRTLTACATRAFRSRLSPSSARQHR